jgi:hypothetical protein
MEDATLSSNEILRAALNETHKVQMIFPLSTCFFYFTADMGCRLIFSIKTAFWLTPANMFSSLGVLIG